MTNETLRNKIYLHSFLRLHGMALS